MPASGGIVLETLSSRKLLALGIVCFVIEIVCFLVGGLVAPKPHNVQQIPGIECVDLVKPINNSRWFHLMDGANSCVPRSSIRDQTTLQPEQVIIVFHIPHFDRLHLEMSPWFQWMLGMLSVETTWSVTNQVLKNAQLTMDIRLGASANKHSPFVWHEIGRAHETRAMKCTIEQEEEDYPYDCESFNLFDWGAVYYPQYLINMRLPVKDGQPWNIGLGKITDWNLIVIHPNGGFTMVWWTLKTLFFPISLVALIWNGQRMRNLSRPLTLLERMISLLGFSICILNCPIDWFTLWFDLPSMILVTDIRQGLFYSFLMAFWIIFCGEHLMDAVQRNSVTVYWKQLGAVGLAATCLFIFDLCERGVQLYNPFYSVWADKTSSNLATAFIVLAIVASVLYFLALAYFVFKVIRNVRAKRQALPAMSSKQASFYGNLIFRFQFVLWATVICAALSVCFFAVGQLSESSWQWESEGQTIEYSSAFLTGVYGMWNIYVVCLLILYAPSHKVTNASGILNNADDMQALNVEYEDDDEGEGTTGAEQSLPFTTEVSALTSFISKPDAKVC